MNSMSMSNEQWVKHTKIVHLPVVTGNYWTVLLTVFFFFCRYNEPFSPSFQYVSRMVFVDLKQHQNNLRQRTLVRNTRKLMLWFSQFRPVNDHTQQKRKRMHGACWTSGGYLHNSHNSLLTKVFHQLTLALPDTDNFYNDIKMSVP